VLQNDKQDQESQALNPELVAANIEMTSNVLVAVIDQCDEECQKMKQFSKY